MSSYCIKAQDCTAACHSDAGGICCDMIAYMQIKMSTKIDALLGRQAANVF